MTWIVAGVLTALMLVALWPAPHVDGRRAERPVGTAGYAAAPEPEDSPATLHDLETIAGALDPHQLLGWRVDFHVKVSGILDPTSFWIGKADNRVLVVAMTPVEPGQAVWITGTVEGRNRDVYIRADSVTPE
ncbi:MAG TPA: hypothetical protein VGJ78_08920 [Vicinamibacterales bacterium]|jgi:hypothetical protein